MCVYTTIAELDGQLATEADSEKKQKLDSEIKDLCELVPDINSKVYIIL